MTDTYSPSDVDVAVKIPEFSLDKSPFLLGAVRSDIEDIEKFISNASKDIFDFYSHMTVLEFFLKDLYESSSHYDQPWENTIGDTYTYFATLLLEKINEIMDKDLEIITVSFLEPCSFIFQCKEIQKNYGSFVIKKKSRRSGSYRKRGFKRY